MRWSFGCVSLQCLGKKGSVCYLATSHAFGYGSNFRVQRTTNSGQFLIQTIPGGISVTHSHFGVPEVGYIQNHSHLLVIFSGVKHLWFLGYLSFKKPKSQRNPHLRIANCWFHVSVDGPATFLLHRTPYGSWREVVRVVAMRSNGEPGKVYTHRWRVQHLALVIIPALDDGERNIRASWALLHWKMFSRCTHYLDCITWGCPLQNVATFGNYTRTKLYFQDKTCEPNGLSLLCYAAWPLSMGVPVKVTILGLQTTQPQGWVPRFFAGMRPLCSTRLPAGYLWYADAKAVKERRGSFRLT